MGNGWVGRCQSRDDKQTTMYYVYSVRTGGCWCWWGGATQRVRRQSMKTKREKITRKTVLCFVPPRHLYHWITNPPLPQSHWTTDPLYKSHHRPPIPTCSFYLLSSALFFSFSIFYPSLFSSLCFRFTALPFLSFLSSLISLLRSSSFISSCFFVVSVSLVLSLLLYCIFFSSRHLKLNQLFPSTLLFFALSLLFSSSPRIKKSLSNQATCILGVEGAGYTARFCVRVSVYMHAQLRKLHDFCRQE